MFSETNFLAPCPMTTAPEEPLQLPPAVCGGAVTQCQDLLGSLISCPQADMYHPAEKPHFGHFSLRSLSLSITTESSRPQVGKRMDIDL